MQIPIFLDFLPCCHLGRVVGQAQDGGCSHIFVKRALLGHGAGDVALAVSDTAHGFGRLFPKVEAVDMLGQLLVCCIVWDGRLGADVLAAAIGWAYVESQVRAGGVSVCGA